MGSIYGHEDDAGTNLGFQVQEQEKNTQNLNSQLFWWHLRKMLP